MTLNLDELERTLREVEGWIPATFDNMIIHACKEPEWAANRLVHERAIAKRLAAEVRLLREENETLRTQIGARQDEIDGLKFDRDMWEQQWRRAAAERDNPRGKP